jgi:hypothetical protein
MENVGGIKVFEKCFNEMYGQHPYINNKSRDYTQWMDYSSKIEEKIYISLMLKNLLTSSQQC